MPSVHPSTAPGTVALVQKKSLIGFRAASEEMWGPDGVKRITEQLPPEVRERTAGLRPLPDWIPLDDLIAWHVTVWNGPAKRDEKLMLQHARCTVDQGFGRVKRLLISVATAQTLAPRVAALWNDEYSTGYLEATAIERASVTLVLHEHPYIAHPLMRTVISEVFRYVLGLTRTKNVSGVHAVKDGKLMVVLRWS